MWESAHTSALCYLLVLQVSFINTKSQLFTLKNNKIVMFSQNIENDEIFYIISSTDKGNVWIKDADTYEFAFDAMPE